MARKKGKGPGQGGAQPQRPQGAPGGGGGGGWGPLRDAVRRDVEQAVSALAFAERLHQKMDTQRRAFLDFPRVMEQLRSGAMERLTAALSRLYEGGQGFDLARFVRDLPLALAHLAVADKSKSAPPPPPAAANGAAPANAALEESAAAAPPADAPALAADAPAPAPDAPAPAAEAAPAPAAEAAPAPVSPRLELRARLLAAAPNLGKAAQSFRRNVATIRRAAQPRRSPGPWRADREVLEEAHRAVEFVQKLYDTYAEAWADEPLSPNLHAETAAELDRFLAWTQLDRYVELAVLASTNVPRPAKPGQQVFSAARESVSNPPATEASPGVVVAVPDPGSAGEANPNGDPDGGDRTGHLPPAEPQPGRP